MRRRFWVKCYCLPAVGLGVGTYINGTRFPQLESGVMVAAAPRCGDARVPVGHSAQSGRWSLLPACRCVPAVTCALCRGLPVGTALTLAAILGVDAHPEYIQETGPCSGSRGWQVIGSRAGPRAKLRLLQRLLCASRGRDVLPRAEGPRASLDRGPAWPEVPAVLLAGGRGSTSGRRALTWGCSATPGSRCLRPGAQPSPAPPGPRDRRPRPGRTSLESFLLLCLMASFFLIIKAVST